MLTQLQGQIERITYVNQENGFTIAKVRVRGRRHLATVVGNLNLRFNRWIIGLAREPKLSLWCIDRWESVTGIPFIY